MILQPFTPGGEKRGTANRLPHWEQDGCTYFVTFRTADSVPAELAEAFEKELNAWLDRHPKPWNEATEHEYWDHYGGRLEKWLDECHRACLLRQPDLAGIVGDALQYHEGKLCTQSAWVVMPNHVHALFSLCGGTTLAKLLHSWKSFTAGDINRRTGKSGVFWQKDYFDRLIRGPDHFWRCARYIRRNPAKLRPREFLLWQSSWVSETFRE